MIDENKLIRDLQSLAEKEEKKCGEAVEMDLEDAVVKYNHGEYCYANAIETVRSQPKTGQWILCNERLPEKVGNYIIHVKTGTGEDYVGVWCYQRGVHLSGKQTYIDDKQGYWASLYNGDPINEPLSKGVIAWQPLPEPYKE